MTRRVIVIAGIPVAVAAAMWVIVAGPWGGAKPIWAGGAVREAPVVSLWDYESGFVRPSADYERYHEPLVVVWADGTVVRLVPDLGTAIAIQAGARENGDTARYRGDRLKVFRTSPAEVKKLVAEAEKAGWFSKPPGTKGFIQLDGSSMLMEVRDGERRRAYVYHGRDKSNAHFGAGHVPSDAEVDAFVMMWNKVRTAIGRMPLTEVGEYKGAKLECPRE